MLIIISFLTFALTLLGGFFAIRFKDRLHLILGFSAGAVIGVVFFDLIPQAIALGGIIYNPTTIMSVAGAGFVTYMILDRWASSHSHCQRGILGATSLSLHSFLDGAALGLAFQVSTAVGAIVALAVLAHKFSDGITIVNVILKNNGEQRHALRWLLIGAIAPVIGFISTLFFVLPEKTLGLILGLFAGFFLYIGASELLPESFHDHPTRWTTAMTLLGILVLYLVARFAGL